MEAIFEEREYADNAYFALLTSLVTANSAAARGGKRHCQRQFKACCKVRINVPFVSARAHWRNEKQVCEHIMMGSSTSELWLSR